MGWTIEEIESDFCQAQEIFLFLQSIQASSGAPTQSPILWVSGVKQLASSSAKIKNE
jgi:hypothetical protein